MTRCLALLLLWPWCGVASTYYVATTGNNANPGTIGSPWLTIRHGVLTMAGGDTLNIRGGTYSDDGFLISEIKSGPSSAQPTLIQSYTGESAVYSPGAFAHGIIISGGSNVVLSTFEINAVNLTSDGIKLDQGTTNVVLTNLFVHGCGRGMGILTTGVSEGDYMGSLITHCHLQTNGWNPTHGVDPPLHQIYLQTSGMTVENCLIQGATNVDGGTSGIQYFGSTSTNGTFRNNYITNCNVGIIAGSSSGSNCFIYNNIIAGCFGFGIQAENMSRVYILNNTLYTNNAQIDVDAGSTNVWVENNIAVGGFANNPGGIYVNGAGTVSVRNNLSYGCTVSGVRTFDYRVNASSAMTTNANLFGKTAEGVSDIYNANFTSESTGDFRIGANSSAYRNGVAQTLFTTDYSGAIRSQWDIGAYAVPVYVTDGTAINIQSNINFSSLAGPGGVVVVPAGNFAISSTITFSNANSVSLQGLGAGHVIARSTSTLTVATGAQVVTTQAGLPVTLGQILTIERLGGNVSGGVGSKPIPSMLGTVTSYSGTTLILNISTINGSGTHKVWIISTQPTTTITNLVAGSGDLFSVFESTTGYNEISGIRFTDGATGNTSGAHVNLHKGSGNPVLVHDNYFYSDKSITCINGSDNKGVVWSNSFVAAPFSSARLAIHLQDGPTSSWNTKSTIGTNDLTGTSNFYIENNDFEAFLNWGDFDDSIRSVARYNIWNNSGTGTHGADTSNYGVRHYEFYENTAFFNGFNTGETLNVSWWMFLRGGTGMCWSNNFPLISSGDYSLRSTWSMTVFNLQQPGGPHGCWGQGTSGGADYPAPRQVGFGNPTGASSPADAFAYLGATEPMYCWSNSGTGGASFGWREGNGGCTPPVDSSPNYIVQNRDFFTNTVAPNYAPYTYPHPLRSQIPPTPPVPPPTIIARATNLRVGHTVSGP